MSLNVNRIKVANQYGNSTATMQQIPLPKITKILRNTLWDISIALLSTPTYIKKSVIVI